MKTTSLNDTQRELWKKILIKDFISSEESEGEDHQVMVVRPLSWRSKKVDRFFQRLDKKAGKNKSKQSKQQTLPRVTGENSSRVQPAGYADDFFGFLANDDN